MRGFRPIPFAAAAASLIVLAGAGCAPARPTESAATATAPPRAHRPAPADPDLSAVTERFYQFVEGGHWPFAYAMLSPRYRATLTQPEFEKRYAGLAAADVNARQVSPSTVVTHIDAKDARSARPLHLEETLRFTWDGEAWTIDRITRREPAAATGT